MRRRSIPPAVAVALTSMVASSVAHAQATLVVRGEPDCPSAEMIRDALSTARPDRQLPEQPVAVDVSNDRLSLTLGQDPAARREFPADRDCAVRAASVALVVAAWSGELASRPSDSPLLPAAAPPLALVAAKPPAKPATHVLELDGGAFYSPVWGHDPGLWLGVGRVGREGGAGLRLLGAYQRARELTIEGGTNQVQRFLLGAAVTYRVQRTSVFASGDLGLVGALTRAQGAGYQANRSDSAGNFGGLAELRGGLRFGQFQLWASARALRLLKADTVKIQSSSPGVADSATLSAWDAQLGMGLGFRFE